MVHCKRQRNSSGISKMVNFYSGHSLYGIKLVRMDEDHSALEIERQARALLVQHDWDLDDLHREIVGDRLAEALMCDDHAAYRYWLALYSTAVRCAATDDPIAVFRRLAAQPYLPSGNDPT